MRLRHPSRYSGFTMVELMVTVTVATILLVLAVPSFVDFIDRTRLRGVADGVADFINNARSESVRQGRNVSLAFGGTTTAWCVGANAAAEPANAGDAIPAAAACDCTTASSCTIGGQQKAFTTTSTNGVQLSAVPAAFTFDNRLGTVNPLGTTTVTMTSPRGQFDLQLKVTPLGRVSLCVPSSSKRNISEYPSC